jgi:hypothetical protein
VTPAEWDAYSDGLQDGIERGYAQAIADVLADLRQASHALIEDGWVPVTIARAQTSQARTSGTTHYIQRKAVA